MIPQYASALLISDLHLTPSMPLTAQRFFDFCEKDAPKVEAVFILGDLFEYWIGDDDQTPYHQKIIQQLASLADKGVTLYIATGNRDFLLGKKFFETTHAIKLNDPHPIRLYNRNIVLMHGDLLCTADTDYLRFRRYTHHPLIQWLFLHTPLWLRRRLAHKLRRTSQQQTRHKPEACLDVTEEGVNSIFQVFTREYLIHGHTHKPGTHRVKKDQQRIVLGAWHEKGSMVLCNEDSPPTLVEFYSAHELINS